jgi:hypothetical protein
VAFLDGDDLWDPRNLAIREHIDPGLQTLTLQCFTHLLRENVIVTTSQVMIPKRVLGEIGPSDTRFRLSSDWDLYLRIAARYKFTFINRPLIHWRYLDASASGSAELRWFRWTEDDLEILKKQSSMGPLEWAPMIREELVRRVSQVTRQTYYDRRKSRSWALR